MNIEKRDYLIRKLREGGVDVEGIPDFETWQGFGLLFEWASRQEWWEEFACEGHLDPLSLSIFTRMIDPKRFAQFLWEFL